MQILMHANRDESVSRELIYLPVSGSHISSLCCLFFFLARRYNALVFLSYVPRDVYACHDVDQRNVKMDFNERTAYRGGKITDKGRTCYQLSNKRLRNNDT